MTMNCSRVVVTLVICLLLFVSADGADQCSSSTFLCPNCGGIQVTDCLDCEGYLNTDIKHDMCIQRRLFQSKNTNPNDHTNHYHFLWNDIVGAVVWFITAGIAMACGVGGGGIYVPLGILLFQFAPKPASGLSQSSIFGASLGGLVLNSRDRHPNQKIRHDPGVVEEDDNRTLQKENTAAEDEQYLQEGGKFYTRPLIHYDMALFLAPMEMAGAVLGVLIQKILPNWLYLLIAGLVLSFTSYKTYKKFFAARSKEKELEAELEEEQQEDKNQATPTEEGLVDDQPGSMEDGQQDGVAPDTTAEEKKEESCILDVECPVDSKDVVDEDAGDKEANGEEMDSGGSESSVDSEADKSLRQDYLEEDARQYPREKITALIVLWIGLFVLTLMKGGKGVDSIVGIECDSPVYAVLIVCQFLWIFGFALFFGRKLIVKQQARVNVKYPYLAGDPSWDRSSLRFYGGFTFVAGIVAGLIGIGGGMVLGPLMLVMGILPRVSAATTATMIVLTSSSVAVIFVISGLIHWSYAVFYFFVCFFGALFGKSRIDAYVKRTGRASLLIFILATIIALATIGCFVILFTRLAENDWCLDGFNKFCNPSDDKVCPADRMLLGM